MRRVISDTNGRLTPDVGSLAAVDSYADSICANAY